MSAQITVESWQYNDGGGLVARDTRDNAKMKAALAHGKTLLPAGNDKGWKLLHKLADGSFGIDAQSILKDKNKASVDYTFFKTTVHVEMTLADAKANKNGLTMDIHRVQLEDGNVALKLGGKFLPDFSSSPGKKNIYREVPPVHAGKTGEKAFISLQLVSDPKKYLRHSGLKLWNSPQLPHEMSGKAATVFEQDVTWHFYELKSTD